MNSFKRRSKTSRLKGSDEAVQARLWAPGGDLATAETQNYGTTSVRTCPMKLSEKCSVGDLDLRSVI